MTEIDLHIHSIYSDGLLSPAELCALAVRRHATGDDKDKPQQSLYDVATANGWNYVNTADGIRALTSDSGRVLAVNPDIQDDDAITYEIDRTRRTAAGEDVLSLADFVTAGTKVLDNDNGFFMAICCPTTM